MEKIYQIALTLLPGIGDVKAKHLLGLFPDIQELFQLPKSALRQIFGKNMAAVNAILGKDLYKRSEEELEFAHKNGIRILFYNDLDYPQRLKRPGCSDAPVVLYYKGNADLNTSKILSVVGTRKASEYGKTITEQIIKELPQNILIVSGLAYGIDICAHKQSLLNGLETVGVLAHGLDRVYPSLHEKIAKEMILKGGIITDFVHETKPDACNFPARNRIIAGLSDATIVIEAGKKGGALITAEIANSYYRDVFAVPGEIGKSTSEGCNYLIKTNKAHLIESVEDIYYILGWNGEKIQQTKLFPVFSPNEKIVYDILLKNKTLNIEDILGKTELSSSKIASALLTLEFQNIIKCLPGKLYTLI